MERSRLKEAQKWVRTTRATAGVSRIRTGSGSRPRTRSPGPGHRRGRSTTRERPAVPLVPRRRAEHVVQRARPARRGRPRRPDGADLRLSRSPGQDASTPTPSCGTRWRVFAGALASLGVGKGDRVIVYMPMVPEAVVAMLACARLGAIHSVVFGGFAAEGTRRADRRRDPEGDRRRVGRDRAGPRGRVQADHRRRPRAGSAPAGPHDRPAARGHARQNSASAISTGPR